MKKQTRQVFGQYETRLGQLNDTDTKHATRELKLVEPAAPGLR